MHFKLLTVGDGAVGKSCLLIAYSTNAFPSDYVPTVFNNYCANVVIDGKPLSVGFWDTAGQEDYDRLRPLSYPQTDIALICFDIASTDSFENVEAKWLPELNHYIPDVPKLLVGCKSDLRSTPPAHGRRMVTHEEASIVAKRNGMRYAETSALKQDGLKQCFDSAFRSALNGSIKKKQKKGMFSFGKKKQILPDPPVMPPAGKAPWLEVETSTFAADWLKAVENPRHSDVTFIVEGKQLQAHKVIICSASAVFRKVLGINGSGVKTNQLEQVSDSTSYEWKDINQGSVKGIARIADEDSKEKSPKHTTIELAEDVHGKEFVQVLRFLYTGVPQFKDDTPEEDLNELIRIARLFQLGQLDTICQNVKDDQEFLNPSIGTYLNDETGKVMKDLFLNQLELADIAFEVEGETVYAHRCILATRCQVMSAMFSGQFAEGDSSIDIVKVPLPDTPLADFLALLEYLYSDHAPIEEGDSVGILMLANQYNQHRLINLCELYTTKIVDKMCCDRIEKSEIDVVGLLHCAEIHNAEQLLNWCRFFISSNYEAFKGRSEFRLLQGVNKEYVEEHRWPPVSYLAEVKEYEKEVAKITKGNEQCVVM